MKKIYIVLAILFYVSTLYSQDISTTIIDPPIPVEFGSEWYNDVVISQREPLGKISAIRKNSNNTIYVAVPDTNNMIVNSCLVIFASSNYGSTWVAVAAVAPGTSVVTRTKMIRNGMDSLYCFLQIGYNLYCWNFLTNNFNPFTLGAPVRDFDAVGSSTGALYLFIDELLDNDIYRYGSVNGGMAWGSSGWVANNGARCRAYMSGTGDTISLNYYITPFTSDTSASNLYGVRYRQTSNGSLSIIDFFIYVQNNIPKPSFQSVFYSGKLWFFWSEGTTGGNLNLKGMVSTNGGQLFGSVFNIANNPAVDEYWFEARHTENAVHIAYLADTAQSSDRIMHTQADISAPNIFSAPAPLSEHPPEYSSRGYLPAVVALPGNDLGVIWVGLDGSSKRVYWDRLNAPVGINYEQNEHVTEFSLSQNYPNPFNPSTLIRFSVPLNRNAENISYKNVRLIVYNSIGQEVVSLVNEALRSGTYEITFNASELASGIYFYSLIADGIKIDTKKMILLK